MPATRGIGFYTSVVTALSRMNDDIWLCVGQADPWDGGVPPLEDEEGVPNPILYKKITNGVKLVKQVLITDPWEYTYKTIVDGSPVIRYFKSITENEARDDHQKLVLFFGDINPGDGGLSEITFRAVGFYQGIVPATGHESDTVLLPADVTNTGNTLLVQNYSSDAVVNADGSGEIKIIVNLR